MKFFLPIAIMVAFCFDYQNDVFWPPWAALAIITQITLTLRLLENKKLPTSAALLFGWVILNGILFMAWRPFTQGLEFDAKAAIRLCSAQTLAETLLLFGLFYTQWGKIRTPIAMGLWAGGLLHALFLIFDQLAPMLIHSLPEQLFATKGLLGNRSIGATFTAVWIFFSLYLTSEAGIRDQFKGISAVRWSAIIIGGAAVCISVSSISFGSMILAAFCVLIAAFWQVLKPWDALRWGLLSALLCGGIGVILGPHIDGQWGQHISRQDAWPMFFKYYRENISLIVGSGAGTFKFYGPMIQDHEKYMVGKWWLWAHNDWLQILFEYGIFGLALASWLFTDLLRKAFARPLLFGSVVCYGATMIGNYPLHIAMTALLGFWLGFEVLWGKPAEEPS